MIYYRLSYFSAMEKIYRIEDINDLIYVGRTIRTLKIRHSEHKTNKRVNKRYLCSSSILNLEHSVIILLEECEENVARDRERYWIKQLNCVNTDSRFEGTNKEYQKEWRSQDWFCDICNCKYKIHCKSKHLKTKKHLLNQKGQ